MRLDLDTFADRSARLDLTDLDIDAAFRDQPLDPDALRCLRYMHDVEHHTICYLRDLLVTSLHRDPEITTFLTMWAYEEHWHGDAIARVLDAHGEPAGVARLDVLRRELGWRDRLMPFTHLAGSTLAGESFVAVHMSWGAVNEWTTQAGYARLSVLAGHPVLSEILRRIMRQEGRHIDVYASQAERRLRDDRRARRLARFALRRLWKPVGANVMPDDEVRFLVRYLFAGEEGRQMADRIDRRVDRLPGLEGLALVSTARLHALAGAGGPAHLAA